MNKLSLLLTASAFATSAAAQTPQGSVERGQEAYMGKFCYSCHGTVGQGGERGAGPKLAPHPFPYEGFAQQIRRPRAEMPRYPVEFLSDRELADIYAYVASIKSRTAKEIPLLHD